MLSRFVLFAVVLAIAAPVAADEPPAVGTGVGEMHPDFLLPRLGGGFLRLSDFRGKKVFLFHFASW